jgi:hypothetical protein
MIRNGLVCRHSRGCRANRAVVIDADLVPVAHLAGPSRSGLPPLNHATWRTYPENGGWTIGACAWSALAWEERLMRLKTLLEIAANTAVIDALRWHGSGVVLDRAAISCAANRWRATGEPPVLQLIAIDPEASDQDGRRGVTSRGLAAIVGREVEALYGNEPEAAQCILLGRLAAHALSNGPIRESRVRDQQGRMRPLVHLGRGCFTAQPVILISSPHDD